MHSNIFSLNYQNFVWYITFNTLEQLSLITGFDTRENNALMKMFTLVVLFATMMGVTLIQHTLS